MIRPSEDAYIAPVEGSRDLWELELTKEGGTRPRNDPERDEICKGLSVEDQIALMDRYGYTWAPRVKEC